MYILLTYVVRGSYVRVMKNSYVYTYVYTYVYFNIYVCIYMYICTYIYIYIRFVSHMLQVHLHSSWIICIVRDSYIYLPTPGHVSGESVCDSYTWFVHSYSSWLTWICDRSDIMDHCLIATRYNTLQLTATHSNNVILLTLMTDKLLQHTATHYICICIYIHIYICICIYIYTHI